MKSNLLLLCIISIISTFGLSIPTNAEKSIRNLSKTVYTGDSGYGKSNLSQQTPNKYLFQKILANLNKSLSNTIMNVYNAQINDALNYKLAQTAKSQIDLAENATKLVEMGIRSAEEAQGLSNEEQLLQNERKDLALKKALAEKGLDDSFKFFSQECSTCPGKSKLSQKEQKNLAQGVK